MTLINKSYGDKVQTASVSVQLNQAGGGSWRRMDLRQQNSDVAAKTGVTLGGAAVDTQGTWAGQWESIKGGNSGTLSVQVPAASATILLFTPAK